MPGIESTSMEGLGLHEPASGPPSLSIALMDPDPVSREVIRRELCSAGHRVLEISTDGLPDAQAIATADAIVLDTSAMPMMVPLLTLCRPRTVLQIVSRENPPESLPEWVSDCVARPIVPLELMSRLQACERIECAEGEMFDIRELRGEQTRMWMVLLEFCRHAARLTDMDMTLDAIVDTAAELTSSKRISLMLPDERGEFLTIARSVGIDRDIARSTRIHIGNSVAGSAFESGERVTNVLTPDEERSARDYKSESFVSMPISTASLEGAAKRVGVLNITNRVFDHPFEEWELEFIEVLGKIAGAAIDDLNWRSARESMLKVRRDLEVAREIQLRTLPARLPDSREFDFAAWSDAAEETGGDTYDVIGLRDDESGRTNITEESPRRVVVLLADATGHGMGPALCVTQVRAMLRMAVRSGASLEQIVRLINEQLCADLPGGRFVATMLAELDVETGRLAFINAGAGPFLHISGKENSVRRIDSDTIPLGMISDLDVDGVTTVDLEPGDRVVMVTDGITEARNAHGVYYDLERLEKVVRSHPRCVARTLIDLVRVDLDAFTGGAPPADDRTAVVIGRKDAPSITHRKV